jgi:MYXO-CTERM domain-containing protein
VNKLVALSLAASASLWASAAFPCGAPYGAGVNVDPHQDIILTHKAGNETYAFQPTFCGDAKDFGLILPVPSLLTGAPALGDDKAFTAVVDISKPTVVAKTECKNRGVGGSDGTDAGSFGGGTTVVASGRVGFLDWTQLKADSETSFTTWLDANGYAYDPAAKTTFASYVSKGWYFVAFKINQGAPTGTDNCRALGPIQLSFPTEKPVIPSRIATAGQTLGSMFSWRVFAITDAAAGQIDFEAGSDGYTRKLQFSGALSDADAAKLGTLAHAGDRLTKLAMFFDGTTKDDVALSVKTAADFRETQYDVTYVDCADDAGPVDDAGTVGDDAGPATNGATDSGSKGCSASKSGRATGGGLFGLLLVAAAVARIRRR